MKTAAERSTYPGDTMARFASDAPPGVETVWVYFYTRTEGMVRRLWNIGHNDTVDTIKDWYADHIYWQQWIKIPRKNMRLALHNQDGSHVMHVAYHVRLSDMVVEFRNRYLVLQHSPLNPEEGEPATKRNRCV